jgi:cytoskeletal protein RodZ
MESIGEKLKTARETRGLSVDQIARETNIARRFVAALEEESFDVFPGEPYLLGFLRNYSDYLGLDADEMVTLYKNFKIQEQPLPMDELLERKGLSPVFKKVGIGIIAAGVLAVLIIFVLPLLREARGGASASAEAQADTSKAENDSAPASYVLKDEIVERRFQAGDLIDINVKNSVFRIKLSSITDKLDIEAPEGTVSLRLGEEKLLDLDNDGSEEIKVFVRDLDRSGQGVVLRFDKFLKSTRPALADGSESTVQEGETPASESSSLIASGSAAVVLKESRIAEPYSVNLVFKSYCLLRYQADKDQRVERYFHKGETFRLDVNREMRIWASNAGSFNAKIGGVDVEFGRSGEVISKLVSWARDDSGIYKLQIAAVN